MTPYVMTVPPLAGAVVRVSGFASNVAAGAFIELFDGIRPAATGFYNIVTQAAGVFFPFNLELIVDGLGQIKAISSAAATTLYLRNLGFRMPQPGALFLECLASIGDSMTWRPSIPEAYPALIGASRNFSVVRNAGIDGNISTLMAARFDADILAWRPGAISIMCGTNDAVGPTNVTAFENAVRSMVNKGVASGAKVTICTPPICRADARPLETYNNILRTIAGDTPGTALLDVYARFSTYSSGVLDALYNPDGVHLNAIGQQWIRDFANETANLGTFTIRV
jgi:lysophospholipase L1-like esterase